VVEPEELNKESSEYSKKISLCNTAMLNINLSNALKAEILQFVMSTHYTRKLQAEYEDFMKDLTPANKTKVTCERMEELTTKNFILHTLVQKHMKTWANIDGLKSSDLKKQAIRILVSRLESKFTTPDIIYIQIEDLPEVQPDEQNAD